MYMMTHPGKKLNFMGYELGHLREWDEKRELDWDIQKYPVHDAFHRYITDLNRVYLANEALWSKDFEMDGFRWLDCHAEDRCVYTYARFGEKQTVITVLNFSGMEQKNYTFNACTTRALVPILDCTRDIYGGPTMAYRPHLQPDKNGNVTLDVPPYGGLMFTLGAAPNEVAKSTLKSVLQMASANAPVAPVKKTGKKTEKKTTK